jgi:hypothetical protein
MFAVFTGSNFGRGFTPQSTGNARLGAKLASYRRQRARLMRQAPFSVQLA